MEPKKIIRYHSEWTTLYHNISMLSQRKFRSYWVRKHHFNQLVAHNLLHLRVKTFCHLMHLRKLISFYWCVNQNLCSTLYLLVSAYNINLSSTENQISKKFDIVLYYKVVIYFNFFILITTVSFFVFSFVTSVNVTVARTYFSK